MSFLLPIVSIFSAAILWSAGPPAALADERPSSEGAPEGVEILLPRGRIPAIFDPVFVPGRDAEIPDSAWVLGVVLEGEARAYSLNLLNGHEVVNDVVGGRPIAAVW